MKNSKSYSTLSLFIVIFVSFKYFEEINESGYLWFLIFSLILVLFKIYLSNRTIKFKNNNKPKYYKLNNILSYHVFWSILLEGPFNAVIILLLIKLNLVNLDDKITLLILFPTALISRFFYTNNCIRILKLNANLHFRITVFRRFKESEFIRTEILPIIGAYGKIFSIADYSLENSKKNYNSDSAGILTELNEFVLCNEDNWKNVIQKFLQNSNLIIFNWFNYPTKNMLYEIKETLKIDNKEILFILNKNIFEKINIELIFRLNDINQFKYDIILYEETHFRKDFYNFIKNI